MTLPLCRIIEIENTKAIITIEISNHISYQGEFFCWTNKEKTHARVTGSDGSISESGKVIS